ncbi:uncharacterized protein LOC114518999 [Dendronephthya gigantea]|uniref:uncharacterized protein LOC114518999 n=1 Tax=Dendronephthya gigantea TaxID=151771 RepID=UPI00106A079E|nr:uncharacterized protein LOC114518999 [Dendronephthya gigantea]
MIADVLPSSVYPQAVYVYNKNDYLILNTDRNDALYGSLQHYFYVANDNSTNSLNQSHAVYMMTKDFHGITHVTSLLPRTSFSSADNTFFVKKFVDIEEDESKCEHGWTYLNGKCYKIFCESNTKWNEARVGCIENEADLASLPNDKLKVATEYFNQIQVRLFGIQTVAVGLHRKGLEWKWLNGLGYNGTVSSKRVDKGRLAWKNEMNDWILEAAIDPFHSTFEKPSDVFFCEKMRVQLSGNGSVVVDIFLNLFWILPGELHVDFAFETEGHLNTIVGKPTLITGVFESRCVGFYCGYCYLVVFMTFAGRVQCKLLSNQTTSHTGSIMINLADWVLQPGIYDVKMGYRSNGDCAEIMNLPELGTDSKWKLEVVGRVRVNRKCKSILERS